MKKILTTLTILIIFILAPIMTAANYAFADGAENGANGADKTTVPTDIFLPTSYLQYYKLDNPYAICRYEENGDEFVAISHAGAIVIYRYSGATGSEQFRSIQISGSPSIGVSSIAKYKNFLLFTQWSNICYIDVSDFDSVGGKTQVKTGYACSNSFSVSGDEIAVTTTEGITYYDLSIGEDGSLNFRQRTGKKYNYETNNPSAVLLTDDGKTYFYSADAKAVYEYASATSGERKIADNVENVKSIAKSKETGDEVYFSSSDGLFSVNPDSADSSAKKICGVSSDGEKDLGKLWNPKGLCVVNGNLWVVDADNSDKDNSINAVQEFDLKSGAFTDFAITTNSKAVNRLTANASDITVCGDKIYALDDDRIVVINGANKAAEERTYNRINLDAKVGNFAVFGDYIAFSSFNSSSQTSKITATKIVPSADGNDPILSLETLYDSGNSLSSIQIKDVTAMDDVFYFVGSQLNHPVLYSFNAKTADGLKTLARFDDIDGAVTHVAADPFNSVYFSVKIPGGSGYDVYKYENEKKTLVKRVSSAKNLLSLQTDLDGKIYLLYENNALECYNGDEKVFAKTLETSKNLGDIKPAAAMCLSCDSRYAYFVFAGLILRSANPDDMQISTPHTISVPAGFKTEFSKNETYGKLRKGAKLFEINAAELSGEFFAFEKFATENGTDDYAIKDLGGKYYLVIKNKRAAVARKTDFIESSAFSVKPLEKKGYAITSFKAYALPVLNGAFATSLTAEKYAELTVTGTLEFNGDRYYSVKTGDLEGFIPQTFVKDSFLSESEYSGIENAYVYAKGGADVFAEDLTTKTDSISSYKKVVILSVSNDYAKIVYDGKIGYVKSEHIVKNSKRNAVKAAAIIILAFSLFVTASYFEKRYLMKSDN